MKLVLATTNPHKLDEIRAILEGSGLELLGLEAWPDLPEPPEDGERFEDNALQKARFVYEATGLPTLADDSGLEVDALGGAPGVRSRRFTPEATAASNNVHLLHRLAGIEDRRARFRCALALVASSGHALASGSCEGRIGQGPRGQGGFGYDPLFLPDDAPGRSMAELSPEEKNRVSHRGRALLYLPGLLVRLGLSRPDPAR